MKDVGLVGAVLVVDEAGYQIRRVAGTSAGAIPASVIAGIIQSGAEMASLRKYVRSLDFTKFMKSPRMPTGTSGTPSVHTD